jgi:cysteinyl-tRNA synthetase
MALRHLGPRFDIHTGGTDNVFPHHEDEIAQSAPIVGGPPARLWVHGAHLLMAGRKMAKSAGNFQRITELAAEGHDPLAFRYLSLTSRYARKLNYSDDSIAGAAAALESLRARLRGLGPAPASGPWAAPSTVRAAPAGDRPVGRADGDAGHGGDGSAFPRIDRAHVPAAPLSEAGQRLHARYVEALDDDLDLPAALAVTREVARSSLDPDERRWLLLDADFVLGLGLDRVWAEDHGGDARDEVIGSDELPAGAAALIAERAAAREAGDYGRADELRSRLEALGLELEDRTSGTVVRRLPATSRR